MRLFLCHHVPVSRKEPMGTDPILAYNIGKPVRLDDIAGMVVHLSVEVALVHTEGTAERLYTLHPAQGYQSLQRIEEATCNITVPHRFRPLTR